MRYFKANSSVIDTVFEQGKDLVVKFNSGAYYRYAGAGPLFEDFADSESRGQYFNQKIKGVYPYEKVNFQEPAENDWLPDNAPGTHPGMSEAEAVENMLRQLFGGAPVRVVAPEAPKARVQVPVTKPVTHTQVDSVGDIGVDLPAADRIKRIIVVEYA